MLGGVKGKARCARRLRPLTPPALSGTQCLWARGNGVGLLGSECSCGHLVRTALTPQLPSLLEFAVSLRPDLGWPCPSGQNTRTPSGSAVCTSTITIRGIIQARRICCCSQPATSYLSPSARCAPVNGLAGCYVSAIGKAMSILTRRGIEPSVGSRGDSYDNALAESHHRPLQDRGDPSTRALAWS